VEGRFSSLKNGQLSFNAKSVYIIKSAPFVERLRTAVRNGLLGRLNGKNGWNGLAAALLLGTRENLEGETAVRFRDAGVSHVLALSGMHLAFLSGLLALFLKPLLGKKGAALGGLVFILIYIFLVGPQPSLIRAGIMYVLGTVILLGGMRRQSVLALAAAFCLQTLWDPPSARGPSFVLSYSALAGLLLLSRPYAAILAGFLPKPLREPCAASLGAFTAAAPAVADFFGILRPIGIAAGLAVVPLISVFMVLSCLYLLLGFIPPVLQVLDLLLGLVQDLVNRLVYWASLIPGVQVSLPLVLAGCLPVIVLIFGINRFYQSYRNYLAPFA
jgi:competence protein ComEC